jgi:hypothetical protein
MDIPAWVLVALAAVALLFILRFGGCLLKGILLLFIIAVVIIAVFYLLRSNP